MMKIGRRTVLGLMLIGAIVQSASAQAPQLSYLEELIERFSDIQVNVTAGDRDKPMTALLHDAVSYRDAHPENAEAWITTARIRAGHAATQGMTSKLGLLNVVKADLEKALSLNRAAQEGRALAFLGMLYMVLPGWPLSFGDERKAALLMDEAMKINATNSANCYYYARYLMEKKQYQAAQDFLLKARAAVNADVAHPRWQKFQQKNIADALQINSGKL